MTRIYRVALRILPREVRRRHGGEMAGVFKQLLHDRRRRAGSMAVVRAILAELIALAWFAWCAHRGAPAPPRIDERRLAWSADAER